MLARATRPKLSLAVPALTVSTTTSTVKSALPTTPILPSSPISPTVRNTRLNQRGFSTLQPPTFTYSHSSSSSGSTKSILKRGTEKSSSSGGKKLQFREEAEVRCVTPMPRDYHGTYVKMSRDERRWGSNGQ